MELIIFCKGAVMCVTYVKRAVISFVEVFKCDLIDYKIYKILTLVTICL